MPDHQQHASPQPGAAARSRMHAGVEARPHARPANAFEARQATSTTVRCSAWPGERQCPRRALEGSTRCALHPAAYVTGAGERPGCGCPAGEHRPGCWLFVGGRG